MILVLPSRQLTGFAETHWLPRTETKSRMALTHLSDDRVRSLTAEEKDRWWLENVYQGDVPQMTVRAVICGFLLRIALMADRLFVLKG